MFERLYVRLNPALCWWDANRGTVAEVMVLGWVSLALVFGHGLCDDLYRLVPE